MATDTRKTLNEAAKMLCEVGVLYPNAYKRLRRLPSTVDSHGIRYYEIADVEVLLAKLTRGAE